MVYKENLTAKKLEASVASLFQTSVSKLQLSQQYDPESKSIYGALAGGRLGGQGWRPNNASITVERRPFIPIRHVIVALGTMACVFVYVLRLNISVAIVAMVNQTAIQELERSAKALEEPHPTLVSHINNTLVKHLVEPVVQKPGTCPLPGVEVPDEGPVVIPTRKVSSIIIHTSIDRSQNHDPNRF